MSQKRKEKRDIGRKNSKKSYKGLNSIANDNIATKLRRVIIISLLFVIFYPPFLRGLFFETEQLLTKILVFAIYIAFWIYKYLKRDTGLLDTPIDYAALGFVAVYFISLFPAIDKYLSISEWLKYCMYFAIFHMVSEIVVTYRSKIIILWTIVITACSVSVIGLDALAGGKLVEVLNRFFSAVGITKALNLKDMFFELVTGNRISSTFQYPNALAAYLMAVLFVAVGLIITSKRLWIKAIGGCTSFIIFVTFILTSSRGAYLMFPVAGIIFLLTLPKGNRLKGLFYSLVFVLVGGIFSFRILSVAASYAAGYNKFWMYIALGATISALSAITMSFIIRIFEKLNWKVYAISISALALTVAIVLVYAFNVTQPVKLSHADEEKDSWKAVQRSAVLEPEKEYKLIFKVEASMTGEKPYAYSVNITSRSEKDILFDRTTQLGSLAGQATQGVETMEIGFKVPKDSEIVRITFANTYQGTEAVFHDATLQEADSGKIVKKLALKYKYIPDALASRLDDIWATKSGVQRLVYYKDGFDIMKERPLLGAGGGAWPLLYFSHQSYLYFSTQAHNYFLQLGVETGIIGLLALLVLLLSFVFMYVLEYRHNDDTGDRVLQSAVFTAICALFMHSFMDFDFSLGAVFILVWVLLGLYNSRYKNINVAALKSNKLKNKLIQRGFNFISKLADVKKIIFSPVIGIVITVVILILPVLFLTAKGYANDSMRAGVENDNKLALEAMKTASSLNPFMAGYKIDYATLLIGKKSLSQNELNEANKLIEEAKEQSKYNTQSQTKIGSFYLATGAIDKGLNHFDAITMLKPLDPSAWETRINAYSSVIEYFINNDDLESAYKYMDDVLKILDESKETNRRNLNPFIFTNTQIIEKIEEYKYIKANMDYEQDKNVNGQAINEVIEDLVFINYPELDVNSDDIPDQWTIPNPSTTKVNVEDGLLVVDNTKTGYGNIVSRKLNLTAGKNYTIYIELLNAETVEKIDYNLAGVSKGNGTLAKAGNIFTADISVPSDFKPGDNVLWLGIPGKASIKDIKIYEQ